MSENVSFLCTYLTVHFLLSFPNLGLSTLEKAYPSTLSLTIQSILSAVIHPMICMNECVNLINLYVIMCKQHYFQVNVSLHYIEELYFHVFHKPERIKLLSQADPFVKLL